MSSDPIFWFPCLRNVAEDLKRASSSRSPRKQTAGLAVRSNVAGIAPQPDGQDNCPDPSSFRCCSCSSLSERFRQRASNPRFARLKGKNGPQRKTAAGHDARSPSDFPRATGLVRLQAASPGASCDTTLDGLNCIPRHQTPRLSPSPAGMSTCGARFVSGSSGAEPSESCERCKPSVAKPATVGEWDSWRHRST